MSAISLKLLVSCLPFVWSSPVNYLPWSVPGQWETYLWVTRPCIIKCISADRKLDAFKSNIIHYHRCIRQENRLEVKREFLSGCKDCGPKLIQIRDLWSLTSQSMEEKTGWYNLHNSSSRKYEQCRHKIYFKFKSLDFIRNQPFGMYERHCMLFERSSTNL